MDLSEEIEFKEKQISKLSSFLNNYREEKISGVHKKNPSEKPKQLPLPFYG